MSKKCGYCVYMNPLELKDGQYLCEKNNNYKFANSDEAENCYKYCERFRSDMYIGEQMEKVSKNYQEEHAGYTAVGCYITTVVVKILHMPDSCYELEILRLFRKIHMQTSPECKDLLIKYDAIGPILAKKIISMPNAKEIAKDLYYIFIKGAIKYIERGRFDEAICLYKEMTETLMKEYLSSYLIPDNIYDKYDMQSSGHGKITLKK